MRQRRREEYLDLMHNGKDFCNSSSVTEHVLHVRPAGSFFPLSGSVGSVLSGCGMALVRHCLRNLWMEMLLNTITDRPFSVADKLLFSQPDKSDIKMEPAVEEEEEPQKKEDKGI